MMRIRHFAVIGISLTVALTTAGAMAWTPRDSAPPGGGLHVVANLTDGLLDVRQGDKTVKQYMISGGKDGHPTPTGTFRMRKLVWNPPWVPPDEKWARKKKPQPPGARDNPMKVVKIFFKEPDYYIHGTSDVDNLGIPASHGCIRMDPAEAAELGKYVMEHGGEPREESRFRRVLRFRSQTKVIYLKKPVSITIQA